MPFRKLSIDYPCRLFLAIGAALSLLGLGCSGSRNNAQYIPVPEEPIYLTARLGPSVKPETLEYLTRVADAPQIVFKHAGAGSLPGEIEPFLFKPPRGITAGQIARLEIGSDSEETRKAIADANPTRKIDWDQLVTHDFKLPYTTSYVSYRLHTTSMAEARMIEATLRQGDPGVFSPEVSRDFEIVPHWSLAAANQSVCPAVEGSSGWPYGTLPNDWSEIDADKQTWQAIIGVIDTGLSGEDKRFTFWNNPAPGSDATADPYLWRCVNDEHGCNFIDPSTPPNDDCRIEADYNHGTHIAGLVSGQLSNKRDELNRRIQLMILKVADEKGRIRPGSIGDAIQYAFVRNANILNLSLAGPATSSVGDPIKAAKNTLFVAASGNPKSGLGIDLDDNRLNSDVGFPAKLAASEQNVISVAAHDGAGELACFSNYGKNSVDLAAPGYNVNSTVSNAGTRTLSGTSQATALVSLTAALLYSRGLRTPEIIKHRIIAATDFDPKLRGKVFSEGKLNIKKALDFHHDLVQMRDGQLTEVEILNPPNVSVLERTNDLRFRGEVYRIVFNYSTEASKRIQITALVRGKLMHFYSDSIGKISVKSSKGTFSLSDDQISEIIPKQGN